MDLSAASGISHEVILITPAMAHDWLKRNVGNRPLSRSRVARYAEDMRNGRWVENGETIKFNDKGDLIDGQHRLEAIVVSGTAARILVVGHLAKIAALTIDDGKKRSHADRLRLFGQVEMPTIAAAATMVIGAALGRANLSGQEVCDLYYQHLVGFEWAQEHVHAHRLQLSPVYAALVVAYPRHPREVAVFAEKASLGENLQRNDPALTLRRYLESLRAKRDLDGRLDVFGKTLRAVQAHVRGERLQKLVVTPELYGSFGLVS